MNKNLSLLDKVINRSRVIVGVSDDVPSLGFKQNGQFHGFDIDFARAIAAAVLDDPNAVEFVVQTLPERFSNVANGIVDVTSQQVTYNLVRDAALNVDFAPITLYDGQVLMVPADSNFRKLSDLADCRIGLRGETTAIQTLQDVFNDMGVTFKAITYDSLEKLLDAFRNGEIDAVSNDATALVTLSPSEARIIGEPLSKEPLAMIVPENQSEWADVIRWVNYVPIQAQEFGITSKNVDIFVANSTDPAIRRFLGVEGNLGESLGLSNDFAVNVIKTVGNLNEIIERNFGSAETTNSFRNLNTLYTNGGIQSSPPFSGEVPVAISSSLIEKPDNFKFALNFDLAQGKADKIIEVGVLTKLEQPGYQFSNQSSLTVISFWTLAIILAILALRRVIKWALDIKRMVQVGRRADQNFK